MDTLNMYTIFRKYFINTILVGFIEKKILDSLLFLDTFLIKYHENFL